MAWRRRGTAGLPRDIWAIGLVSLLMDASSELVHSLLPVLLVSTLGASMATLGLLEGLAEATSSITKVFSGALSDHWRKRKSLAVAGYALGALTKPVFPLATSVGWVFAAHIVDRIGKGIRGAPRDALVADITPPALRGAAYGLRQALDSVGALLGPLLAIVLLARFANDIPTVLWAGVITSAVAVVVLIVTVREPNLAPAPGALRVPLSWRTVTALPRPFWWVVALAAVVMLARFSEAFLVMHARDVGLGLGWVPAVMMVLSAAYALGAYPAGLAADRFGPRGLLTVGLLVLVGADLLLARAHGPMTVFAGAALWGLHMALTQGLLSKLVADTASSDRRGTAFGVFNLVGGVAMLMASTLAGLVWTTGGPAATFLTGGCLAAIAAAGVMMAPASTPVAGRS